MDAATSDYLLHDAAQYILREFKRMHPEKFTHVKDSGKRQEFDTGSRRDTAEGKGRPDLIPTLLLERLGQHFENGARKYGDNNWQKGQPLSRYYASAFRHLLKVRDGKEDEDHLTAAIWNLQAIMWTLEEIREGRLPDSLLDLPFAFRRDAEFVAAPEVFSPVVTPAKMPGEVVVVEKCAFCNVTSEGGLAHTRWCAKKPPTDP